MRAVLPHAHRNKTRIITNMGVANVRAAGAVTLGIARELGLFGLKIALIEGDDVTASIMPETMLMPEDGRQHGLSVREMTANGKRPLVGANAYLGIDALLPALRLDADVIITGRVADPSLFLAPLVHHYGWAADDWTRLGRGTLIGHLLECGMQITGGYFADPPFKIVPRLADCGFPIAEVAGDGSATITKLDAAGGLVSTETVKEQLLYEVHDPAAYLTPDVTADFSRVSINQAGPDRVAIAGAGGTRRPDKLKVTVGFDGGFLGEGGVSYAGPGAGSRAHLAADVLSTRFKILLGRLGLPPDAARIDVLGSASLHKTAFAGKADRSNERPPETSDARVHVAIRSDKREDLEAVLWDVESLLCCGPAGGGGYRGSITASVTTASALIERSVVVPKCEVLVA